MVTAIAMNDSTCADVLIKVAETSYLKLQFKTSSEHA